MSQVSISKSRQRKQLRRQALNILTEKQAPLDNEAENLEQAKIFWAKQANSKPWLARRLLNVLKEDPDEELSNDSTTTDSEDLSGPLG